MDGQSEPGAGPGTEPDAEPAKPRPRRARPALIILLTVALPALAEDRPPPKPPCLELELKMFGLVNADRQKHKQKPLAYDNALAAVARAHSADMLKHGFFNHKSPTTGLVADRLFAAKVMVMASAENIAMHNDIDEAEAWLMQSPRHRKAILNAQFSHCGIGIVQAANGTCIITQVFAARPPVVDLDTLGADVVTMLNKVRAVRGKQAFVANAALDRIAAAHVAAVAKAGKPVAADLRARARAAGVRFEGLSFALVSTWDPGEIASAAELIRPDGGQIGIALARNTSHKDLGYGIIWVFAILTHE